MIPESPAETGEERLIARYFRPLVRHPGALGLADDVAVLAPPPGTDLVLTKDALVAGVHFFPDDPPAAIARKALRVNLSDLAAKGAKPAGFLLALALPKDVTESWLKGFAEGLGADADAYACPLLGGDTVKTPGPLTISITALGTLPKGSMVARGGAGEGDRIFVTGTIGDAALGLKLRQDGETARRWKLGAGDVKHLLDRYGLPQPRGTASDVLREYASAAMDVSDGLAGDLGKLCSASHVSADVEIARIPLSGAARLALAADAAVIETILTGGDDYEIVCTIPAVKAEVFRRNAAAAGVEVAEIGTIVAGDAAPRFISPDGQPAAFSQASYSHF